MVLRHRPGEAHFHRSAEWQLMNRRIVLISSASLGLLLSVITLAILTCHNGGSKLTVSFVKSETSNGQFPSYVTSERLDFAVRNAGSKPAFVDVSEIENEHGNWVPSLHVLGDVEAGQSTQFYLYLPLVSPWLFSPLRHRGHREFCGWRSRLENFDRGFRGCLNPCPSVVYLHAQCHHRLSLPVERFLSR